jgi:hypothetical protein
MGSLGEPAKIFFGECHGSALIRIHKFCNIFSPRVIPGTLDPDNSGDTNSGDTILNSPRLRANPNIAARPAICYAPAMPDPIGPHRPELMQALALLARLNEAMAARGLPRPILVGGAAVEYYSASALMTGDIDLASPVQPELEEELRKLGFTRPGGPGHTPLGWIHPELKLGFEVVASTPMGGSVDHARILLVGLADAAFAIIPVEDLIADRMGQYASGTAPEMLGQARALYDLHPALDRAYLEREFRGHNTKFSAPPRLRASAPPHPPRLRANQQQPLRPTAAAKPQQDGPSKPCNVGIALSYASR